MELGRAFRPLALEGGQFRHGPLEVLFLSRTSASFLLRPGRGHGSLGPGAGANLPRGWNPADLSFDVQRRDCSAGALTICPCRALQRPSLRLIALLARRCSKWLIRIAITQVERVGEPFALDQGHGPPE